jgi:hypothetical protein
MSTIIQRHRRFHRRRGVVYLFVIGTALLVSLLAMSSLMTLRARRQVVVDLRDGAQARILAQAAVETGLAKIASDDEWRTTLTHGTWATDVTFGPGKYSLEGLDPADSDLGDDESEPILLVGTGMIGRAVQMVRVTLIPEEQPLDVLDTGIHAGQTLQIQSGGNLNVSGAPASVGGNLQNDGTLTGNVEAATKTGGGSIVGQQTIPSPAKTLPSVTVMSQYQGIATTLPYNGDLTKKVLAPGFNDYGGSVNTNGVYYLNTAGNNLTIQNTRLSGTLVIDAPGKTVTISDKTLLVNFKSDYPVLIVNGNVSFEFTGAASGGLSESAQARNYNPAGAAYSGQTDADNSDTYPSEVVGLVHVLGNIEIKNFASRFRGTIVAHGNILVSHQPQITYLSSMATDAPWGYVNYATLNVSQGSWQRSVE